MAVQSGLPVDGIKVLVQGGAHLDFRNKEGLTALHKAVRAHNHTGLLVRTQVAYVINMGRTTNTVARLQQKRISTVAAACYIMVQE